MNKIVLLFVILFFSCSIASNLLEDDFTTQEEISDWMYENIEYKWELAGEPDEWQTPQETLELGTGDCEDFSILWLYLVYDNFGVKGKFYIAKAEEGWHSYAETDERSFYKIEPCKILYTIDYDTVMFLATIR